MVTKIKTKNVLDFLTSMCKQFQDKKLIKVVMAIVTFLIFLFDVGLILKYISSNLLQTYLSEVRSKKNTKMITEDYTKKLTRMRILERERKQRIFNDKQRLIGVDKQALDDQVRERKQMEEILHRDDEIMQKNLVNCSLKAIEREQITKHLAYRDSEYQRQLQNILLAKEQRFRNRKINQETLLNIPTDDYYNYFNTSSR